MEKRNKNVLLIQWINFAIMISAPTTPYTRTGIPLRSIPAGDGQR